MNLTLLKNLSELTDQEIEGIAKLGMSRDLLGPFEIIRKEALITIRRPISTLKHESEYWWFQIDEDFNTSMGKSNSVERIDSSLEIVAFLIQQGFIEFCNKSETYIYKARRKSDGLFFGTKEWGKTCSNIGKFYEKLSYLKKGLTGSNQKKEDFDIIEYKVIENKIIEL